MANTYSDSQESDIVSSDLNEILSRQFGDIIESVQSEQPFQNGAMEADLKFTTVDMLPDQQTGYYQFQQLDSSTIMVLEQEPLPNMPSPTAAMLSTDEYPGPYGFEIQVDGRSSGKNWVFSYDLNKLFISVDTAIHLGFKCDVYPPGLYIRAVPVYTEASDFQEAVERCLHHRAMDLNSLENCDESFVTHVVRIEHQQAIYDCDKESERKSVRIGLDRPQVGSESVTVAFKFVCKNSCMSGMGRRSTELIFTLEDSSQNVFGRRKMKVRICSCPKRDKNKEEDDWRAKSGGSVPQGKKKSATPKMTKKIIQTPPKNNGSYMVEVDDLKSFSEISDLARLVLKRKLRAEKRKPTEREEYLLKKYKDDARTYEDIANDKSEEEKV